MVNRNLVNKIRHGSISIAFEVGEVALSGEVEMTVREPNGDRNIVRLNGAALVGVAFKYAAEMMKHLDVVQRAMEDARP